MDFFIIIVGIIFTIFSTAILSYISMATMVGPWIAPIIVLMSSAILKFRRKQFQKTHPLGSIYKSIFSKLLYFRKIKINL